VTIAIAFFLTLYLLVLTVWDFRRGENPWYLTTPLLGLLLVWRVWRGDGLFLLGVWGGVTLPLLAGMYGAADYRLLLVLLGLFPHFEFLAALGIGMFALSFPVVLWRVWRRKRPDPSLPSTEVLLRRGSPGLYVFTLPGIAYLWFALARGMVIFP